MTIKTTASKKTTSRDRKWEKAGDNNAVSDGNMTCAEYFARWGEHSDYCDHTEAVEAPVLGTCQCNCGGSPKGKNSRFLPGHDARNGGFKARMAAAQ